MKLRSRSSSKYLYSITFEDFNEQLTILELKTKIKKRFLSLRKYGNVFVVLCLFIYYFVVVFLHLRAHILLSFNGKSLLNDEYKLNDYELKLGDTIEILNETISMDQPITLDEVRDCQTYPVLMHRLIEYSQIENDLDWVVCVLHALMLESGFQMVCQMKIKK